MEPGATVNCDVKVWARCWPSEPSTPPAPPGTVTVSVAPGTSGPVAWYSSSAGESTAQAPGTAGFRVGMGLSGARSVENSTEMAAPAATLVPVGETDDTVRAGRRGGRGGRRLIAPPVVDGHEASRRRRRAPRREAARITHIRGRLGSAYVVSRHGSGDSTGEIRGR